MSWMGHKIMLLSSGLAFIACQGCIGTAMSPQYEMTSEVPVMDLPERSGVRMATQGAFTDTVTVRSTPRAADPVVTFFLNRESTGPQVSARIDYSVNEVIESPFSGFSASSSQGAGLTNTSWSTSDGVQSFIARRDAARLIQPTEQDKAFAAEFELGASRAQTGLAFDVNFVPSVSYVQEGEFATRSVGAEVRLGRDFDQRGTSAVADSWYIFAGTEGEALVWEAGEYGMNNFTGAVALRDQVTVGDLQAGVSVQRGPGQLSLSYIRREVEWRDRSGGASEVEDFAGVSFTIRQ